MPMEIASNEGLAKLRWRCTGDPDQMICTIGIRAAGGGAATAFELADKVAHCWTDGFAPGHLSSTYTFEGVEVTMGPVDAPSDSAESPWYSPGGDGFAALPSNCAALVRKRTAVGGRKNHGRMFLPAGYLAESRVGPTGVLATDLLAELGVALNDFQDAIEGDDNGVPCQLLLFHQNVAGGTGDVDGATVITDLIAQPMIATQRRRMR
jgi:hypothetical protein